MGQLKRNSNRLLHTVHGRPHATASDHEDEEANLQSDNEQQRSIQEKEEAVYAEPESPGNRQLHAPPPRQEKASLPQVSAPKSSPIDSALKQPRKKAKKKEHGIRTPPPGSFGSRRAAKAKRHVENDKENLVIASTTVGSSQDNGFDFGLSAPSAKRSKTDKKRQYGKAKEKLYVPTQNIHMSGKSSSSATKVSYKSKEAVGAREHDTNLKDDNSDVSMMSEDELERTLVEPEVNHDPELHFKAAKENKHSVKGSSKAIAMDDSELETVLGNKSQARLLNLLDDWMQDQGPSSSEPISSGQRESLNNIKEYMEQLPEMDLEGTRCALCREYVDQQVSWNFWEGKEKSVKNHTLFCLTHRRNSAREDYVQRNIPSIDWTRLPTRIRQHRAQLVKILQNKTQSKHRTRYEPLALTGKAAMGPSRRNDLPSAVQEELTSYALDDHSSYPGYYGPNGRRVITETVMKLLKPEVNNCKDRVVQGSGPAAFVQAVLVPETAVLLIEEDCQVDREEAEKIREETVEMGVLLNEEIEDNVAGRESEDEDENEYKEH